MRYRVLKIEEDMDFGCEECSGDVMAVVTLQDENGVKSKHRFRDKQLYASSIEETDSVYIDENGNLEKIIGKDWTEKCGPSETDLQKFTNKMMNLMDGKDDDWTCPFCGGKIKLITKDEVFGSGRHGIIGCTNCDMRIFLDGSTRSKWAKFNET